MSDYIVYYRTFLGINDNKIEDIVKGPFYLVQTDSALQIL